MIIGVADYIRMIRDEKQHEKEHFPNGRCSDCGERGVDTTIDGPYRLDGMPVCEQCYREFWELSCELEERPLNIPTRRIRA